MSPINSEFATPIYFAKMYFGAEPLYFPLKSCHVDFLSQFSRTTIQGWRTYIGVSVEETFESFQSSLVPDSWLKNSLLGN